MQGWYSEYCEKTGQFCDQVKLKHSTKDRKTGSEIVYNVPSSSGYHRVPASPDNNDEQNNEDDINISYFHYQTTTTTPQPGKALKLKRRRKLMDKLKNMFEKLGGKYKKEKKKISLAPRDFLKKEKTKNNSERTKVDEKNDQSETFHNKEYDEFFDFVPMEYEAVEDVMIENY